MQVKDAWFWKPRTAVHTLATLKTFYHANVGANVNLLMDIAPDNTGLVPVTAAAQYKAFGDWWRKCYGSYVAVANNSTLRVSDNGTGVTLTLTPGTRFDRIVIQEDQTTGQRIRAYHVRYTTTSSRSGETGHLGGGETGHPGGVLLLNGTSIGNKRIHLLGSEITDAAAVTLSITMAAGTAPVLVSRFGLA